MTSIVKSSAGIALVPVESRLLSEQRKIFIKGEINSDTAYEFVTSVMLLVSEAPDKPIDIYIVDSPGGTVTSGLLIYDTIKSLKNMVVNIHCVGMASSIAAVILAGGQKGRRFALPRSTIMIHEPLLSGGVGGSATNIQRTAESIVETKKVLVDLLAQDTGKSRKKIEAAIAYDNRMTAEQAIEFGLCDHIETKIV